MWVKNHYWNLMLQYCPCSNYHPEKPFTSPAASFLIPQNKIKVTLEQQVQQKPFTMKGFSLISCFCFLPKSKKGKNRTTELQRVIGVLGGCISDQRKWRAASLVSSVFLLWSQDLIVCARGRKLANIVALLGHTEDTFDVTFIYWIHRAACLVELYWGWNYTNHAELRMKIYYLVWCTLKL